MEVETILVTRITCQDPDGFETTWEFPWPSKGPLTPADMQRYVSAVSAFTAYLKQSGYTPVTRRSSSSGSSSTRQDRILVHHPTQTVRVYNRYFPKGSPDPWKDVRSELTDQHRIKPTLIVMKNGQIQDASGNLSDPPPDFPDDIPKKSHWILPISALEILKNDFSDWYNKAVIEHIGQNEDTTDPEPEIDMEAFSRYAHAKARDLGYEVNNHEIKYFLRHVLPENNIDPSDRDGVKRMFSQWVQGPEPE